MRIPRQVAQEAIERYNKHIERCNRAIEAGESLAVAGGPNEMEQLRTELIRVAEERDTATRDRDVAREELRRKSETLAGDVRSAGHEDEQTRRIGCGQDVLRFTWCRCQVGDSHQQPARAAPRRAK
jgi:hypothetical protein